MPHLSTRSEDRIVVSSKSSGGNGLYFKTANVVVDGNRLTLAADRTDSAWEKLRLLPQADALKRIILATVRQKGLPAAFVPECSSERVVIGFRGPISLEMFDAEMLESLGFSQPNRLPAPKPKKSWRK